MKATQSTGHKKLQVQLQLPDVLITIYYDGATFKRIDPFMALIYIYIYHMSRGMRFPTIWYVRPAKAQTSLRIQAD